MTLISKIWKSLTSILSNLKNFYSLEVIDRVSKTTSSGWKFQINNSAVKGLMLDVVFNATVCHAGIQGSLSVFIFQRNNMFLPRPLVTIQHCGEHSRPRVSVSHHIPQVLKSTSLSQRINMSISGFYHLTVFVAFCVSWWYSSSYITLNCESLVEHRKLIMTLT